MFNACNRCFFVQGAADIYAEASGEHLTAVARRRPPPTGPNGAAASADEHTQTQTHHASS